MCMRVRCRTFAMVAIVLSTAARAIGAPTTRMTAAVDAGHIRIGNSVIEGTWEIAGGRLAPVAIVDGHSHATIPLKGEAFQLKAGGQDIRASELRVVGQPMLEALQPDAGASRLSQRA